MPRPEGPEVVQRSFSDMSNGANLMVRKAPSVFIGDPQTHVPEPDGHEQPLMAGWES